jgi:hypothetical protein
VGRFFAWAVGLLLAREAYLALGPRRTRRRKLWVAAVERAQARGVPLVVIGAPGAGVVNRIIGLDYGCGNLCIDPGGCGACANQAIGRAEDVLPELAARSAVIYISCTLEYVDDPDLVMREARRIAGNDVFVATVEPMSLTAWFYPHAQHRVFEAPAGDGAPLRYKSLPWAGAKLRELPCDLT